MSPFILSLALILGVMSVFFLLVKRLNQPMLLAAIGSGILLNAFGVTAKIDGFSTLVFELGSMGVLLLLFLVGIELSGASSTPAMAKHIGFITMVEIFFTGGISYVVLLFFGLSHMASLLVAIGITFSSTIIGVKLLSEDKSLTSLTGQMSIGILVFQDVVALVALSLVFSSLSGHINLISIVFLVSKLIGFYCLMQLFGRFLVKPALLSVRQSSEGILAIALAWALSMSSLAGSPLVGLSPEIGAFLAGLSLSRLSHQQTIAARLRPIRDFFLLLFFVSLGFGLEFSQIVRNLPLLVVLVILITCIKPLTIFFSLTFSRYQKRTSVGVSLLLGQLSEFSLIISAISVSSGLLSKNESATLVTAGVISMLFSTYTFMHQKTIVQVLTPILAAFERKQKYIPALLTKPILHDHIVLIGHQRSGRAILPSLRLLGKPIVVIDFDPRVIASLDTDSLVGILGDASDVELLEDAHIKDASVIISTIADVKDNELILDVLGSAEERKSSVVMIAEDEIDRDLLYKKGADYVFVPRLIGGSHIAHIIKTVTDNRSELISLAKRYKDI